MEIPDASSSSRAPALMSVDTSAVERLVEDKKALEREEWRVGCEREREWARGRQRDRVKGEEERWRGEGGEGGEREGGREG